MADFVSGASGHDLHKLQSNAIASAYTFYCCLGSVANYTQITLVENYFQSSEKFVHALKRLTIINIIGWHAFNVVLH